MTARPTADPQPSPGDPALARPGDMMTMPSRSMRLLRCA